MRRFVGLSLKMSLKKISELSWSFRDHVDPVLGSPAP